MGWLEGRVALVTGGSSGIGRAVVDRFVDEGARVAVLDRSAERLASLDAEFGDAVVTVAGDVRSMADNDRAVEAAVERFGGLDTFVGNAGVFDYFVTLSELSPDRLSAAFDEIMGINVKGYLFGAKAALPHLRKAESPSIVFTASNASFYPAGGGVLYTASKHAVIGLVRQLAYELAPKIRVNGVAPGGTLTDMRGLEELGHDHQALAEVPGAGPVMQATTPLQILSEPRDHAGHYVLLASPRNARATTGVVINSDGGLGVRGLTR